MPSTENGSALNTVTTTTPPTSWSNTSMLAQSAPSSKASDHAPVTIVASMDSIQDGDFRFMIKAILLSITILAELWLVSDFVNNFLMILVVIVLLWTVCGGHASLCAVKRASATPNTSPPVTKDMGPWLSNVITAPLIEVIEVVDFPIGIVEVVDFSEMEADYISPVSTPLTAALLCDTEDDQGLIACMNRIVHAIHHVCVHELTTAHSIAEEAENVFHLNEEQKVALALRNETRAQGDVFQGLPVSHARIDSAHILDYLVNEHGNSSFKESYTAMANAQKCFENHHIDGGEIFYDMNASVASQCDWELCSLGRSVFGDASDMRFMLDHLRDELPAEFVQEFEQSPFESRYRGRDRITNANFWHNQLTLQWYKIKTANTAMPVENWDDTIRAEHDRVRRSTPAYPDIERGLEGPCSRSRSYLNESEDYIINIGIAEYNQYCDYENTKLSQLQKNLDARPGNTQSPNQNHILKWLFSMDECQQLDPNAFDTCDCGVKAVVELKVYRDKVEHGLIPASFFLQEFPISYAPQEVVTARWNMKDESKETTDDDCIPRCQKILLGCKLHEIVSNNIFVLINTSVDDINNRISDPEGLLPAPGQMVSTKFPFGYHTQPRFLTIPYDILTKRCEHGHPEYSLFGPSCQICFPKYQAELVKNQALGRSQNVHIDPGFRNVPPLFQLCRPPGC
ncbi:hypothetical protein HBI56_099090 [Parastagonospora nodorum]|nr:hypothetical protein HBI10_024980 [Parastagonospora nodorum]KAH4022962.1 hypothetical protein HBI13_092590 [Parastagonospora nodorum]KAH4212518.1 hypothetical protein HBI95_038420 [Parastagonospora nodorum]KAH5077490.1 hypothetical protein HBH95_107480 [Parastagonospora nodorum]KAH5107982.1 hypothetical protein HBH72_043980 [Parastagonospora nodorum]